MGDRIGLVGFVLNRSVAATGDRKPLVEAAVLLRTGENLAVLREAWLAGVGEVMDIPSSLMDIEELNERSTSMGNSVSVPVGEGGEEGNAERV